MIRCPVCENVQSPGEECEVCGRPMAGLPGAAPVAAVAPLDGLEPTAVPPVAVPAERLEGLEATRLEAEGTAPAESPAWLEATRAEPALVEPPAPLPELEHHRAAPLPEGEGPDPLAPVVCRYCRTPAIPGEKLCGRCGMKLPLFEPARIAEEAGHLRCPTCGRFGEGPRCRFCGERIAPTAR